MNALTFITCGSVDDGKSTLIGRLLLDSKAILSDQLANASNTSHRTDAGQQPDLAAFTDGLQAEREQLTCSSSRSCPGTPRGEGEGASLNFGVVAWTAVGAWPGLVSWPGQPLVRQPLMRQPLVRPRRKTKPTLKPQEASATPTDWGTRHPADP